MIYLIVGHRGVGKSTWLKKIKKLFKNASFLDLDQEIEKKLGKKIKDFLSDSKNLKPFRLIEKDTLNKLIEDSKNKKTFIAVGAGFKGEFTKAQYNLITIIHLARETDEMGRVFLDRPRLKKNISPFQEYKNMYLLREKFYQKIRDENLILFEQDFNSLEIEKLLFDSKKYFLPLQASITLNKKNLPTSQKKLQEFIKKRIGWGLKFFELRDDELNAKDLEFLLKIIPKENRLLSFRKNSSSFEIKKNQGAWDWPLEKGKIPLKPTYLSLHKRRQESVPALCRKLTQHSAQHFKLAIPINNFTELYQGHLWFLKNKKRNIFLPISKREQSWRWYREIFGPQMSLHFIRESRDGIQDQPFLCEHLIALKKKSDKFAAVLGKPIAHSASPAFHRDFFLKQGMLFTRIPMTEKELTKKNLDILQKMGLIFIAVTSPLKKQAFKLCDELEDSARLLKSVNTMVFKNNKWWGANTDIHGLKMLLSQEKSRKSQAVWGGGGMKKVLEKTMPPNTSFYSARTGECRKGVEKIQPELLIWSVGRGRMPHCKFPPPSWKPKCIIDLNYSADSPGLELALRTKTKYISGRIMFEKQAQKQQEFFLKINKKAVAKIQI